jgi:nitrite reductase/ring-hydroxylating ferredoxin subunit
MTDLQRVTELTELPPENARLQERNLRGEVFLVRQAMQKLGVFDAMKRASIEGIQKAAGDEIARKVEEIGFERIHEVVSASDIPRVTDAAYQEVNAIASKLLQQMVPRLFGHSDTFYFEKNPNVRFHIPYDDAAPHRAAYAEFGKKRGEGKITAHGPHRDSWLECPTNCVNVWVAVGAVLEGNGLLFYPDVYGQPISRDGCHIRKDANPGVAVATAMGPGDALIFHGDQVHGSELNYTDRTRHVVSFRLCLSRPEFRDLNIHDYMHSDLAKSPVGSGALSWVAEIPAKMGPAYVRTRAWQIGKKLGLAGPRPNVDPPPMNEELPPVREEDLKKGEVRALDRTTCVARTEQGALVAFARRCTHEGADLSFGRIEGNAIHCPWHNVPFDLETGKSPCQSLTAIRTKEIEVDAQGVVGLKPKAAE